jgi:hypothetical protein
MHSLQVLPQAAEERMADLSFRRLRAVLDFGQQFRLNPNSLARDVFGVGLRLPDERFQSFLQFGGRNFVEAVVYLACVDEIVSLAPADV